MPDLVDYILFETKSDLRASNNILSVLGEQSTSSEMFNNKELEIRTISNNFKVSDIKNKSDVHKLSLVLSGFIYDLLVDIFQLERNPFIVSDAEVLIKVSRELRKIFFVAISISNRWPSDNKFAEIVGNMLHSIELLNNRTKQDFSCWKGIILYYAKKREIILQS